MKLKIALVGLLVLAAMLVSGCGIAQNVLGGGGSSVGSLWSDVPPLPNSSKANVTLPLPVQLGIQAFMQAANADASNDTKLDKFDFVGYTTSDTPEQVANFYTADKMKPLGWNQTDTAGCTAGTGNASGAAGFCVFGKQDASGKQATVLMIVPVQDDTTKQTQVFFVRFEATKK